MTLLRQAKIKMKSALTIIAILLGMTVSGYAQQDPNDPGEQDSIIVGEVAGDSGIIVFVPIFAVTDDSVAFYNFPLRWNAPLGGVYPESGFSYFSPIAEWDEHFDTVMTSESYIRQIGFSDIGGDDNPILFTNGHRVNIWTIPILLNYAHRQMILLDTTWDSHNLGLTFGLAGGETEFTPGFRRGIIGISGIGDDKIQFPEALSLSQNYPNPFNSSTEIEFALPQSGPVTLVIYDIQGREVRRLLDSDIEAGSHRVIWDGIDNSNEHAASGIYFYRLISDGASQTNRMTLLR
jgi:hypothetical protein